jgi:hypothetical protein
MKGREKLQPAKLVQGTVVGMKSGVGAGEQIIRPGSLAQIRLVKTLLAVNTGIEFSKAYCVTRH